MNQRGQSLRLYDKLVVDIDDTILFTTLTDGVYAVDCVNTELIKNINYQYVNGATVIIHTARHWDKYKLTQEQLDRCGVLYNSLVMGKPTADLYIDDKGVTPDEFLER